MNEKLKVVIADIFDVDPETITSELSPDSLDNWDSLNHLKLVTAVEQEFGVKFTMSQIENINSVASLEALLQGRV